MAVVIGSSNLRKAIIKVPKAAVVTTIYNCQLVPLQIYFRVAETRQEEKKRKFETCLLKLCLDEVVECNSTGREEIECN